MDDNMYTGSAPVTPSGSPAPLEPEKKQYGPTIGIILIVILLALGGLYFWGAKLLEQNGAPQETQESDPVVGELQSQSASDEVDAIDADVEATNLDDLDAGLDEVEAELQVQ